MVATFANDTVTRIRPGIKTERGSETPDWDNPESEIEINQCSIQPASTSLSLDGRVLAVMDGLTVYVPYGSDVKAGDHIVADGETYEINGEPRAWKSPTGNRSNIQLNLVRWTG
ncbi:MAG: hypothetical protein IJV68_05155 [Clostridia bacterium]|nr:hypothetical protein [Clostridia bacterium]MBR1523943.1 hypothetical protein [Lachnospiraceae bacterium]